MGKKYRHPITTETNLLYAISHLTGLTWNEMEDEEIIWFMLVGLKPTPRRGLFGNNLSRMYWVCQIGPWPEICGWTSGIGYGGSKSIRDACRQHLRDKHQKVRTK